MAATKLPSPPGADQGGPEDNQGILRDAYEAPTCGSVAVGNIWMMAMSST